MATLLSLVPSNQSTALVLPLNSPIDISYAILRNYVHQLRDVLHNGLGVRKGDVVAMSYVNSLEFVVAFFSTGAARAVSAPLNPSYSPPEVKFYLEDTKPILLLLPRFDSLKSSDPIRKGAEAALAAARQVGIPAASFWIDHKKERVRVRVISPSNSPKRVPYSSIVDPSPEDIALVLHTSGTTGRPKSVPLSHHNLVTTTNNIIKTYDLVKEDRSYLVMPLFHVHGLLAGLLAPLRSGGSVVVPDKFSAGQFWNDFIRTKCNWYTAVPTIHSILLSTPVPNPLPKIKFIRSCSSALAPATFHRLESTFKAPVLEAYAMTEAAHQMTSNIPSSRIPGTVGIGIGVEVGIFDDRGTKLSNGEIGEVCVRGENVTKGYWKNDKANKESFWEGGWFRTGDQGLILREPPHHIQLTGRLKELINRGGEKISPLEIDAALLSVDGVKEAVCFGVEDAKYGEIVWAGVVLDEKAKGRVGKEEEERIKKALEGKIAPFKIPQRIVFTPSIPKTATGKIQRRHVRDALVKQAQNEKAKL